ncbi:hypothetical protein ACJIZ3_011154 [Penstemon smallii]|uniref:Nuclease associated modular domain-containing protein n=1 Tax=Penstemon smallii TaxID=265156 RepID=A0ABD3UIH4_9LAMI
MLSCPLKVPASRVSFNLMPRTLRPPSFGYVLFDRANCSTFGASFVNNISPCIGFSRFSSCMGPYYYYLRAMQNPGETEKVKSGLKKKPNLSEKMKVNDLKLESFDNVDNEKVQKRKTGHGNKGRVPWNKGRKHSEETREKIRQRTKEALKDPKVRKKMSECPRYLSNQTKVRIRASLTKLWDERLKWKRTRAKFFQSWRESIAKAAKIGANDQQELDWDSYEKIKREIDLLQLHKAEEKAKAKEIARIQAEKAAQLRAEKMAMLAQKRKEREEIAKARGEKTIKKRNKKSKEEKEKLAEFEEVKLKKRLMKIHKKKSLVNQVSNQNQRSWEKFDVDFVNREQLQKDAISLADQIISAKNKRAEQLLDKALIQSFPAQAKLDWS